MTLLSDPVFWVSIASLVIGAYRFSLTQIYKSKCVNFKLCWGLVNVNRDVQVEAKIDEKAIEFSHQDEKPDNNDII